MQNTFITKWSQAICRILNNLGTLYETVYNERFGPFFSYFSYKVVVYLKPDEVLRLLYSWEHHHNLGMVIQAAHVH